MMGLTIEAQAHEARFREPFRIAGHVFTGLPAVRVTLDDGLWKGRGEAGGVYFLGDDTAAMLADIDRARDALDRPDRQLLREILPPCGARNALDAALWELESHRNATPVWRLAGMLRLRRQVTTCTLGAEEPAILLRNLAAYRDARALKLKLDGDLAADAERLRCVHAARPDAWLMVDANQGYTPDRLEALLPDLVACGVRLIEQPLARGMESGLDGMKVPIPLAADESVLGLEDLPGLVGRFQFINIKLDKCGGLTEALMMAQAARRLGLGVMVGNMGGTSLAAAPAYVLAQTCDVVDLDGPTFLAEDMAGGATYADGMIAIGEGFWGATSAGGIHG